MISACCGGKPGILCETATSVIVLIVSIIAIATKMFGGASVGIGVIGIIYSIISLGMGCCAGAIMVGSIKSWVS